MANVRYKVERAATWEKVDEAAHAGVRCIKDGGTNNVKAKQTWDVYTENEIQYWIVSELTPPKLVGYVRLLAVSTTGLHRTWIVDYVWPTLYEPVLQVAKEMDGTVLCKEFSVADDLFAKNWPRMMLTFPKLEKFPYHNQPITESTWCVVPK